MVVVVVLAVLLPKVLLLTGLPENIRKYIENLW